MTAARTGPNLGPVKPHTPNAASLPIFRAGTHTSVDGRTLTFTPEILRELADGYDPALSEAPLVVGHPALDAPAYGWTKSLRADGGVLYAEPHQVEAQFAELVNTGRFKKLSASIYLPDSPGNPKPGRHYLRHVGFLGAAAPAVKGLRDAAFADDGHGAVEFAQPLGYLGSTLSDLFQRLRDWFIEREGAEAAEKIIPQWSIRSIESAAAEGAPAVATYAEPNPPLEITMAEKTAADAAAAFAEREQQITAQEADIRARAAALTAREAQARREDAVGFADQLVADGKFLPREKPVIVELLLALPADTSVSFAEADGEVTKPAGEVLRQLLTDRPRRIDFQEKSPDTIAPAAAAFAAPAHLPVDAARAEQHARAVAYQAERPNMPYLDAVRAVGG